MHIFYLIDTENVGKQWLDFIDPEENATIYLFCNANIKFSLTDVQTILSVSSKIHIIQCIPGKNFMDFFIIMKLGGLLSLHKKAQFYIVSGDHDFDGVIKEYNRSGCDILPRTKVRGFLPLIPGDCASAEPLADPVLRSSTVGNALPT